jgi:hypothetical protein
VSAPASAGPKVFHRSQRRRLRALWDQGSRHQPDEGECLLLAGLRASPARYAIITPAPIRRDELVTIDTAPLISAFSKVKVPDRINGCECQFCISSQGIRGLIETPIESINSRELITYTSNVLGTVGGPADFRCLLPKMLHAWAVDIQEQHSLSAYTHLLHAALNRDRFFLEQLTQDERDAATAFMRERLLARIDSEVSLYIEGKTRTHEWFDYIASYGTFTPDIPCLFDEWWQMRTKGHAVAAVQYASCFIAGRLAGRNPLFSAWTPNTGGGPPSLSQYDSSGTGERWLDSNIAYLEAKFGFEFLMERLLHAKQILASHPQTKNIDVLIEMADARTVTEFTGTLADELRRPT